MANTNTNLSQQMLQDEVLPALKLALLPLNAFSLSIQNAPKNVGDKVTVDIAAAASAAKYTTTFETGDTTNVGTDVTMEAPDFSSFYINPNLEPAARQSRFLAKAREAAYAVGKLVMQDVLGNFVAANIGAVDGTDTKTVTAVNYDSDDQADLITYLRAKGVSGPMSMIHTLPYTGNLMKDTAIKAADSYGGNTLVSTGELPPIYGTRQFYTDAFPAGVLAENTGVIGTGSETAAIAIAMPNIGELGTDLDAAAGVRFTTVQDQITGIGFILREWVNTSTGAHWGSVYISKGQSFLRDSAVRIISA